MGRIYCADCAYMDKNPTKDCRFKCVNSRSGYDLVAANMCACSVFSYCLNSNRSAREAQELYDLSRKHGYYIVTAISAILQLPVENIYINYFSQLYNYILPKLEGGEEWKKEYDEIGPIIEGKLRADEDKISISTEIMDEYLDPFVDYIDQGMSQEAFNIYDKLYNLLKIKYIKQENNRGL